jgi:hypothetical protein
VFFLLEKVRLKNLKFHQYWYGDIRGKFLNHL